MGLVCTGMGCICTRVPFAPGTHMNPNVLARGHITFAPGLCLHGDGSHLCQGCVRTQPWLHQGCVCTGTGRVCPWLYLQRDRAHLHQGGVCTRMGPTCTRVALARGRAAFARAFMIAQGSHTDGMCLHEEGGRRRTDPFAPGPGLCQGCVCTRALCTGLLHGAVARGRVPVLGAAGPGAVRGAAPRGAASRPKGAPSGGDGGRCHQ